MTKRKTSMLLSALTTGQIAHLARQTGLNQSEVIAMAIDRMYQQETTMTTDARKLATEAVEFADAEGYPVADTTVVGKDANGYWVADNGEEVDGLTKEQAVEIIVENLTE